MSKAPIVPNSTELLQSALTWQQQLVDLIRDPLELQQLLQLPDEWLEGARAATEAFALRVPRPYVSRIELGNAGDPLLKQVLPLGVELQAAPGYSADPLGEREANPLPGLVHKYKSRVLLMVSTSCAINCRYCFRREFPYAANKPGRNHWQKVFDYIRANEAINEVILSGGDPLTAPDRQLAWLASELEQIPHLRRLRIHTRLPIVIPARVCSELLDWLGKGRLQKVVVVHCNHPQELDESVAQALTELKSAGVTLLNQAVLLKGVNDSVAVLCELSERLFALGVLPYYLHLLDRVQGAAHFEVDEARARTLYQALLAELPGFLVPKLVREIAGQPSKTPVL